MQEKNFKPQLTELCLLDLPPDKLELMLSDPEIALALTNFEDSIALKNIDELFNLHEAPTEGLFLNTHAVKDLRDEWTIQIPTYIYQKLSVFIS